MSIGKEVRSEAENHIRQEAVESYTRTINQEDRGLVAEIWGVRH